MKDDKKNVLLKYPLEIGENIDNVRIMLNLIVNIVGFIIQKELKKKMKKEIELMNKNNRIEETIMKEWLF